MLRWGERGVRVRLTSALRDGKLDDDTGKARETVKERNYRPSHVILAFCCCFFLLLLLLLFKPIAAIAAAELNNRTLSPKCLEGGQRAEDTGACWHGAAEWLWCHRAERSGWACAWGTVALSWRKLGLSTSDRVAF